MAMLTRRLLIASAITAAAAGRGASADTPVNLWVSIPTATHSFTAAIVWWANKAKADLEKQHPDLKITVKTAANAGEQANQLQDLLTANKINALVIFPFESAALTKPVAQVKNKGVYVTVVDRGLTDTSAQDAYVAGDNTAFGKIPAEYIAKKLDGKGDIVALRGIATTLDNERMDAFLAVMKNYPGIKLLETTEGIVQKPTTRWLPGRLFGDAYANKVALLYYTGLTRMAKNILHEIVRGMFLNAPGQLEVLEDIGANALRTFDVLQRADYDALGHLKSVTWPAAINPTTHFLIDPPITTYAYDLDGQLVISHDILGTFVGDIAPRFVRRYAAQCVGQESVEAFLETELLGNAFARILDDRDEEHAADDRPVVKLRHGRRAHLSSGTPSRALDEGIVPRIMARIIQKNQRKGRPQAGAPSNAHSFKPVPGRDFQINH